MNCNVTRDEEGNATLIVCWTSDQTESNTDVKKEEALSPHAAMARAAVRPKQNRKKQYDGDR